jgi:DNA-directed RNA polymerase subunit beta
MASNMQRQAVPLVSPEAPIVGTGYEKVVAESSGRALFAESDGEVVESRMLQRPLLNIKVEKSRSMRQTSLSEPIRTQHSRKGVVVKAGENIQEGRPTHRWSEYGQRGVGTWKKPDRCVHGFRWIQLRGRYRYFTRNW